ncbi:MAG: hypothetical protein LBB89_09540 [Treponema sp.]|jgi:hypothetical protein|nr:hypothetical protein [Treponema sp.]
MKYILSFLLVAIVVLPPVFGYSLEELTGAEQAAVLRAAVEPITEVQHKTISPRLLPRHDGLAALVAETLGSLDPNLFVETLFLYHKPSAAEWNEAEQINLLNQLTALSTLAGIQYYSESRKTMRTFYESSRVIDSPANKMPLPDPVFTELPDSLALYARQKDLTFGDNIYRFVYYTNRDSVFFVQENLTAMTAGIIPAVGKNKFRSLLAVLDTGDYLLMYAAGMAKTVSVPGMGDRIGASFTNRAKAILKWFGGRADKVFHRVTPS